MEEGFFSPSNFSRGIPNRFIAAIEAVVGLLIEISFIRNIHTPCASFGQVRRKASFTPQFTKRGQI